MAFFTETENRIQKNSCRNIKYLKQKKKLTKCTVNTCPKLDRATVNKKKIMVLAPKQIHELVKRNTQK